MTSGLKRIIKTSIKVREANINGVIKAVLLQQYSIYSLRGQIGHAIVCQLARRLFSNLLNINNLKGF